MKKLLSVVLSVVMVLGMVMPMGAIAEETTELTQAERFELISNPYTSFDLNLFEDFFATEDDFANANWDQSSTAAAPNILAYKGFAYTTYANHYPNNYAGKTEGPVTAFETEKIEGSTGITPEADGSYTYTIGSVPFELGTIAEKGKMGANAFLIRARYNNNAAFYPADASTPINEIPSNYLDTSGKTPTSNATLNKSSTIGQGVYTIDRSGLKSAELLMTALWNNQTTYHTVYVTYEGESTPVKYFAVSGYGTKNLKDNIFLVPKDTYDKMTGHDTMKLPTDYTLEEFKNLVGDNSLTTTPANWKNYSEVYTSYLEETKYYKLNGDTKDYQNLTNSAGVIKLKSKETAVDLSKLSANTETKVLLPTETQNFVPARRKSATKGSDDTYATTYTYKISVPLDPNKTVKTIKVAGELRSPVDFVEESGGVSKVAKDSIVYYGKLMLKYNGSNIYTDGEGNQYYIFIDISRECGTGALLGMTLVDNETLYDEYVELNEELKTIDSSAITNPECLSYRNQVAQLIAKSEGNLIESDFDLSKIEEAAVRLLADRVAALNTELAEIDTELVSETKCISYRQQIAEIIAESNGAYTEAAFNTTLLEEAEDRIKDEKLAAVDKRIWFDLKGNSKFFMPYSADANSDYKQRPNLINYVPGVDYTGSLTAGASSGAKADPTGVFATDFANAGTVAAFIYSVNEQVVSSMPVLKTEDNENYFLELTDLEGEKVSYKLDVNSNVIKLFPSVDTQSITANETLTEEKKEELIKKFNTLKDGVTFDVPEGKYKEINFLMGLTGSDTRRFNATFIYEDGDEPIENIAVRTKNVSEDATDQTWATIRLGRMDKTDFGTTSSIKVTGITLNPNPDRVLKQIKVKHYSPSEQWSLQLFVLSAYGLVLDYTDTLAEIEAIVDAGLNDAAECDALKAKITEFEGQLAEASLTVDDLTKSQTAVYNNAKALVADFEANADRIEKLNERKYTYLEFTKDRDVFASYHDIADLAKFQKPADIGSDGKGGSAISTGYNNVKYSHNGEEIFMWLPHVRGDGTTPVTGKEKYYYKGFVATMNNVANADLSSLKEYENDKASSAGYVYIAEDLIKENGTALNENRVNASSSSATHSSKDYKNGDLERIAANRKVKNPTFVQKMDENGYVIIKNGETQHKIGPISADDIKHNAMMLPADDGVIEVGNVKGKSLDLLITTFGINYSDGYRKKASTTAGRTGVLATAADPNAALQQVVINYADGTTETKKMLVPSNTYWDTKLTRNTAFRTIVFAPKYDDAGEEIVYDEKSFFLESDKHSFTALTSSNVSKIGMTEAKLNSDTIKFVNPSIIYSDVGNIAQIVNNRQDAVGGDYGTYSSYASIPLQNKEVVSIDLTNNVSAAVNDPTAIAVATDPAVKDKDGNQYAPTLALLPVTIEGASDEYVYFAYLGRIANSSTLMGATIMDTSAAEKIEAAEAAMQTITLASTIEEAVKAKEIYEEALAHELVEEKDFDPNIVSAFNTVYAALAEKTDISGNMEIVYYQGEAPAVTINVNNITKLAGKPYSVIIAYYDADGNYISSHIENRKSTANAKESFVIKDENYPANTMKVKSFIWKDLSTMIPLANAADSEVRTTLRILSIGNSYSQDAQSYLYSIAKSAGLETIEIGNAYYGGCSLEKHLGFINANSAEYTYEYWTPNEDGTATKKSTAKVTLEHCIKAKNWDIITIQQQSFNSSDASTYEPLGKIIEYVNQHKTNPDAKYVWHMTWGYAEAYAEKHDQFKKQFGGDTQKMYEAIVRAVQSEIVPNENISFIIPSGTAVQNARLLNLDSIQLSKDGTHLNELGDYVAGLTWFSKLTGVSVDDVDFVPNTVTLTDEQVAAIKKAVKDALANPYEVTK